MENSTTNPVQPLSQYGDLHETMFITLEAEICEVLKILPFTDAQAEFRRKDNISNPFTHWNACGHFILVYIS